MFIRIACLLSAVFCCFSQTADEKKKQPEEQRALELVPAKLDFGKIFDGAQPVKSVTLRNKGASPLTIKSLHTDCGCAIPRVLFPGGKVVHLEDGIHPVGVLKPGEEASMEVCFHTWGWDGKLNKNVTISTDDSAFPVTRLKVKAEIIDSLVIEPEFLDLGEIIRGRKVSGRVILRSKSIGDFDVKGIKDLPSYLQFSAKKLSSGENAEVMIEIKSKEEPPLGEWMRKLHIEIVNEHINQTRLQVKAKVVPKVCFSMNGKALDNELDFGVFPWNEGKTAEVDITNLVPEIPYHPLKVEKESAFCASCVETRLKELKAGELYRLVVRIRPVDKAPVFVRGALRIISDHPDLFLKRFSLIGWPSRIFEEGLRGSGD